MAVHSLRERKKQKNHERLVEIATRLFLEKGFENTTIDEIVKEAELSQRTFFRYFATKESIVFRDHDEREQRLRECLEQNANAATPFEAIKAAMEEMGRDFIEDRDRMFKEYSIVMSSKLLTALDVEQDLRFQRIIADHLHVWNGKEYLSKYQASLVAGAIFGTIRGIMENWFESRFAFDLEEMRNDLNRVIDLLYAAFPPK